MESQGHNPESLPGRPPAFWLGLYRSLFGHRDLLRQLVIRDLEDVVRGSLLGSAWLILGPLLLLVLYTVVFGVLMGAGFSGDRADAHLSYGLGIYLGLLVYGFWRDIAQAAPNLLVANRNYVRRVVFPLEVLPLTQVGSASIRLALGFALWFGAALILGVPLTWRILWLPLIVGPLVLFSLGTGWALAALGAFVRDLNQALGILLQIAFWTSGIFYDVPKVQQVPLLWDILRWNPLLLLVEATRQSVLWHEPLSLPQLGYAWGLGLVVMLAGFWLFRRLRGGFAEVV